MPRARQKPPGMEKWTWDEINSGRKMSKGEKKYRSLAVTLGATKAADGRIQPPAASDNPTYWLVFIGLLVVAVLMVVFSAMKK